MDRSYDGDSDMGSRSRLKKRRHKKHKKDKKNKSPSPSQKRNRHFSDCSADMNEASADSQTEQAMRVANSIKGHQRKSVSKVSSFESNIPVNSRSKLQGSIAAIFGGTSQKNKF